MKRQNRRRLRRAACAVAASLVAVTATAAGAYLHYDSRIHRVSLPALALPAATPDAVQTGNYFLIAGSDTRDLADGASFQSSSAAVTGQRADTVLLVHIPQGTAQATVMSFPRDLYVTIPAWTSDTGAVTAAHSAKLNEALALGGADLLITTIEQLTAVQVDHYLAVNFDGFRSIVDAVGGVTLCVTTSRDDADSGDHLSAGVHENVSGDVALAFVRDRKGLIGGDLARIQDQQYFLSQLLHKVLSAGTLTSPGKVTSLLAAVTGSLTVDDGFGLAQFRALATHLASLSPAHVTFVAVPVASGDARRTIHGVSASVVLLDAPRLPAALRALTGATGATSTPTASTAPTGAATALPSAPASSSPPTTTSAAMICAP